MNPVTYPPIAMADNVIGIGQIPEGLLTAAYLLSPFSTNRKVYRLDFTGETLNAVEETALAIAPTAKAVNSGAYGLAALTANFQA